MINVCLNDFLTCHLLFWTLILHRLFQNKVNLRLLNFLWPLNRGKENRKPLIETTKRWVRPLRCPVNRDLVTSSYGH